MPAIGRYELQGLLGKGGFASVFRAWDPVLRRHVALKALLPHLIDDPGLRDRFEEEARAIAGLRHPCIVNVYDVGEADGRPFFTMELVEGPTLAAVVAAEGRLPLARVAVLLRGLCGAVDHLHNAGLVHRDIKLTNAMLDEDDRVVLMDFGIARNKARIGATQAGTLLGTPEAMSPEQVRGEEAGPASDIYALGVVAYYLLAGRPPFVGESFEVLHAHVFSAPPPLTDLVPDLPETSWRVVEAALAKDPAQRPPRAASLAEGLAAALASIPTLKEEPVPPEILAGAGQQPVTPDAEAATADTPEQPSPPPPPRSDVIRVTTAQIQVLNAAGETLVPYTTPSPPSTAPPATGGASHVPAAPTAATGTPPGGAEPPAAASMEGGEPTSPQSGGEAALAADAAPPAGLTDAEALSIAELEREILGAAPVEPPPPVLRSPAFQGAMVMTVAGTGIAGYSNGPAATARLDAPVAVTLGRDGTLYVSDAGNHVVRSITAPRDAVLKSVSVVAGSRAKGFADGPSGKNKLAEPRGLGAGPHGTLYIADYENNRLRRAVPDGGVSTIIGSGLEGVVDGTGTLARLARPRGVAVDPAGVVYVSDNHAIRRVTPEGEITTIAGSAQWGEANGSRAEAGFTYPWGLCLEANGNLLVADTGNHVIRRVTPAGEVSTVAGTGAAGHKDGPGDIAEFNEPRGVAVDTLGNIYVADTVNHVIRCIDPDGAVTTVAGSGHKGFVDGPAELARFNRPYDIAVAPDGAIYIADEANNRVRLVIPQRT
jgi:serine/threonine protein kinase/sugar lactone lactonase YvrE